MMRRALDRLYAAALWVSAAAIALIFALVALQVAGRALDGVLKLFGLAQAGFVILSLGEISGYLLASASFLALPGTLVGGAHIRVNMALQAVGERRRRVLEIAVFALAAVFAGAMTGWVAELAHDSWRFNEISPGMVPVPLMWPQAGMALGLFVFTIALADEFICVLRRGTPSFRAAEDATQPGKEG